MIVCEKYSETLNAWLPFAALVVGEDDNEADRALAEDINVKRLSGKITVNEPTAPDIEEQRADWIISPLQFRRGLREWGASGDQTWRDQYDTVTISAEARDELEYALRLGRNNPHVAELVGVFGWTDEQTDAFFQYCLTR
jgi:hypothetical protein